jgi:hypothetical protein
MCRADQRLAPIAIGEHFHQLGDVVLAVHADEFGRV